MDLEAFLEHLSSGKPVEGGSEAHLFMHGASQEALKITAEINGSYHDPGGAAGPVLPADRAAGG